VIVFEREKKKEGRKENMSLKFFREDHSKGRSPCSLLLDKTLLRKELFKERKLTKTESIQIL